MKPLPWYQLNLKVQKGESSFLIRGNETVLGSPECNQTWSEEEIAIAECPIPNRDVYSDTQYLAVSEKIRDLFMEVIPGQVEFYPIRIQSDDASVELHGYYLMRVMAKLCDIDTENPNPWIARGPGYVVISPALAARIRAIEVNGISIDTIMV